jgi:hypothetical protein
MTIIYSRHTNLTDSNFIVQNHKLQLNTNLCGSNKLSDKICKLHLYDDYVHESKTALRKRMRML